MKGRRCQTSWSVVHFSPYNQRDVLNVRRQVAQSNVHISLLVTDLLESTKDFIWKNSSSVKFFLAGYSCFRILVNKTRVFARGEVGEERVKWIQGIKNTLTLMSMRNL